MLSVFDLFSIGIGPSSSHTVGPMRAAGAFVAELAAGGALPQVTRVVVHLYGSLGATGAGHGTYDAVLAGLSGHAPETVTPRDIKAVSRAAHGSDRLRLAGAHEIAFHVPTDLPAHGALSLPGHSNGLTFSAYDDHGRRLAHRTYYSIGGGFVVHGEGIADPEGIEDAADIADTGGPAPDGGGSADAIAVPHPFRTGDELLRRHEETGLSLARIVLENELTWRSESDVRDGLLAIWAVMQECVAAGCRTEGMLPGGLRVRRRAPELARRLQLEEQSTDPMRGMDWVTLWALAVNEENAAGGRVVTAPTNGAAGIIPSVLHYYTRFVPGADEAGVVRFLLVAGAIGMLYKEKGSISGAEVGCQGEVGSACSMAAGGLADVLGGTARQVENAAEIGMEHNLGLTCDPVGGLVQIPCIERNAIASVKAIAAARTALWGDGTHLVSLDKVIKTMRETGADMRSKYKETARGGLAVNVIEC